MAAGLASAATLALIAAPVGAKLVCPPGVSDKAYCITVANPPATVAPGQSVKVSLTLTLPSHVTLTFLHHGKVVKHVNEGVKKGKIHPHIKAPTRPGTYTVRIKITHGGVTQTINRTVKVT